MDLSIIVVNWNSADYLRACLASVYRNVSSLEFEVIVIDNDSRDGCEEMLRKHFPQTRLIVAHENLGFARANNLAYKLSSGQMVLFLNPDTEVRDDAIQRMVAWLRVHPKAGAAGARLLNRDGSLQENCVQPFPTLLNQFLDSDVLRRWFPRSRLWGKRVLIDPQRKAGTVDSISGACYLARREAFEAAGRFSEEFFMYSDDLDLSLKIRRASYSIVCLPDCEVLHHGGGSSARQSASFADIRRRESMAQFFRRERGPAHSSAYRILVSCSALLRLGTLHAMLMVARTQPRREILASRSDRWRKILAWSLGMEEQETLVRGRSHA